MQSPDNAESSKIRLSSSNSKLHTPCRQIGLRRKKSRTSSTPIKENTSPEVTTDITVEESEPIPTTPTFRGTSDCTDCIAENQTKENCLVQKVTEEQNLTPAVVNIKSCQDERKEVEVIKKRIKEKEEKIAALRLARLYRKKHDTSTLRELTERWREGCQAALQELLSTSAAHGYQINMTQLITQLGIPFHLIHYNPDLEDFE